MAVNKGYKSLFIAIFLRSCRCAGHIFPSFHFSKFFLPERFRYREAQKGWKESRMIVYLACACTEYIVRIISTEHTAASCSREYIFV